MDHFSIRLWCVMKSGFYMTTSNNQLRGWTEKKLQSTSQSQTCSKKGHGYWWSAACLIHCSFLNPSEIWDECSASRWDAPKTATSAAGTTAQKTGPNSSPQQHLTAHCTSNASKVEWTGLPSFASSAIFTWFLENWLPLLQAFWQAFAGKMLPQPAGGRKYFLRVHRISKHRFLCCRNQQTNFSLAKMCWF